ncbi:AAA family ATPase [Pseudomonas sp. NGC7]|uniref:AAA family ATPase n=1 Tax=Pseudomonas sp. NGC7 TaxID=3341775 RepID=UPI0037DB7B53
MHFHFERLGLLDEADIELADLTLICGENNTGKTYATYGIYGFLRSWRSLLRAVIGGDIEAVLKDTDRYQLDLQAMFGGKIDHYLGKLGRAYIHMLPRVFATEPEVFKDVVCISRSCVNHDFAEGRYQHSVKSGPSGKVLATITKESGSVTLEVLVADIDLASRPFGGLIDFVTDAVADIVFSPHLPNVHISSAERTGAAIFRKELDMARTRMIKAINEIDSKELRRNPFQILHSSIDADYAWPVEDNVEFVRHLEDIDKRVGGLASEHPELINAFDSIIGGSYKVVKQQLVFQAKGAGKQRFTMNEASSCVRALLDIGFYLRCKANPGDLFIIDEPELNLHPKAQRAFARLVGRMVNAGLKVFITTHSDYLVKELNTLIMLHQRTRHTRAVQEAYKYDDGELLDPNRIKLYMTGSLLKSSGGSGRRPKVKTLIPAKIDPAHGIEVETFDDTIDVMNDIQGQILYGGDL